MFLSLLHTTSSRTPTQTRNDRWRQQAPGEAGEPSNLGTGPEAQGKGAAAHGGEFRPSLHRLSPAVHAGDPDWDAQCRTRPAYLEDRGQVLGHFQSLSLHRVDHILHPGAGAAMGQGRGKTVAIRVGGLKNLPGTWPTGIEPRRRHPQRRGGGGAAPGGGRAQLSPGRRETRGPSPAEPGAGARAASPKLPFVSPPPHLSSPGHPFRLPPSSFSLPPHSAAVAAGATWASRDSSLPRHVTTRRAAGGGGGGRRGRGPPAAPHSGPPPGSAPVSARAQWAPRPLAPAGRGSAWAPALEAGGSRAVVLFLFFAFVCFLALVPGSYIVQPHQWAPEAACCCDGARQSLSQLYDVRSSARTFPEPLR